jgi:eukaryotic-like serine/threonine-protein kinase
MALHSVSLSAIEGIGGSQARPRPAALLGPYRLLDRVGAGAYAAVYRARHEVMDVERAIKLLRPRAAGQGDQLLREARVAARLRHPNVVGVLDCGVAPDGTPYIVMEYVAGRSLADRLRDGVPPPAETLHVAERVAAALDHAHGLAVVHRDVKPANVLLGDDGAVRLTDFGIAQAGAEPDGGEPWAGLGTPAYMAPEQRLGQRAGAHTDVYALAVVVYEMLTGRTPRLAGRPPMPLRPASAVNPCLPAAVDDVLAAGLAHDPSRRPASAGRLVSALALALGVAPEPARPRPKRGLSRLLARRR